MSARDAPPRAGGGIDTLGTAKGDLQTFDVWFEIAESEGLLPGFRGHVIVPGDRLSDVVVVPVSAVHKGRVWVKTDDGKDEPRDVTIGRSDSQNVGSSTRKRKLSIPVNRRGLRPSQRWNASTIVDSIGYSPNTANRM